MVEPRFSASFSAVVESLFRAEPWKAAEYTGGEFPVALDFRSIGT